MDSPGYRLEYKYYQSNLCRVFGDFFDRKVLCDVTLVSDGRLYKAHRFALSAASPYFESIFVNLHANQHPIVFLKDVSHSELDAILEFIYKGETTVSHNLLPEFLDTCEDLQIRGIGDQNYTGNGSNRTVENVSNQTPPLPMPKNTSNSLQKSRCNSPKNKKLSDIGTKETSKNVENSNKNTKSSGPVKSSLDNSCNNVESSPNNTNFCDRIRSSLAQSPENVESAINEKIQEIKSFFDSTLAIDIPTKSRSILNSPPKTHLKETLKEDSSVIIEPSPPQEIFEISDDETAKSPASSTQSSRIFTLKDPDLTDIPNITISFSESMVVHGDTDMHQDDISDGSEILIPRTHKRPHFNKQKLAQHRDSTDSNTSSLHDQEVEPSVSIKRMLEEGSEEDQEDGIGRKTLKRTRGCLRSNRRLKVVLSKMAISEMSNECEQGKSRPGPSGLKNLQPVRRKLSVCDSDSD